MPFRSLLDGEVVVPAMVEDSQVVECPDCGGTMYPRGGEEIARHFYHVDEQRAETCPSAGESDIHFRCKALAVESLNDRWGNQAAGYGVEFPIDVSYTPTEPRRRQADAAIEFESRNPFFGRGLIIEIQYRNKEKDIRETTYDYISADFSVAWLCPDDFDEEYLDYSTVNDMFAAYPASHDWQGGESLKVGHAVSVRHRNPDTLGPIPEDLETYRSYPHPGTDISERRWSFMKNPWR